LKKDLLQSIWLRLQETWKVFIGVYSMVKIMGICGSPRQAATEYALKQALEAAASVEGVETTLITLSGKKINFCIHCNKCINEGKDYCTLHKDDMTELYQPFYEADGYLIASPVYDMGLTGQLATFFNRFRATYTRLKDDPKYYSNKVAGAIAVGGTRNGGQENTINCILNFCHTLGITVVNGGMGCYAGAAIWSQDRKALGAEEDFIGIKNALLLGEKVAEMAKIIKNFRGKEV
jgi:multimeric flavodoxin WrbA